MKPAERKRREQLLGCARSIGIVLLTLCLLVSWAFCAFLILTPALPVTVSLVDRRLPVATAPQRTYKGDDMKGKHK